MKEQKKYAQVLKSFVLKYTAVTVITVGLFFGGLYALIYFGIFVNINETLAQQEKAAIKNEIAEELYELGVRLAHVEDNVNYLQETYESFFRNDEFFNDYPETIEYNQVSNGAYLKTKDNGNAVVYYGPGTPLTEYAIAKAERSEWLDVVMKYVVKSNPLIEQAYFRSFDDMLRLYPFNRDIEILDAKNNATKEVIEEIRQKSNFTWTDPAYDQHKGWVISCIASIYNGDFFEGYVGIDVPISDLMTLSSKENYTLSSVIVVDENGRIIAINEEGQVLLGVEDIDDPVMDSVMTSGEYNINNIVDPYLRDALVNHMNDQEEIQLDINNKQYLLLSSEATIGDWRLLILTPQSFLVEASSEILISVNRNVFILSGVAFLVLIILLVVYNGNINKMGRKVAEPMEKMAHHVKQYSIQEGEFVKLQRTGIREIDVLNNELKNMVEVLAKRTDKLLEAQIQRSKAIKTIEVYHKEATTDELTQLYNRRKIDDLIDAEVKRCIRYKKTFSMILLDVDFFKQINDKYGHQIGDEILIEVANVLKKTVRESDHVARWGGDEFLIVTVENNEEKAAILGEKIRVAINTNDYTQGIKVSSSVGVADFNPEHDDAREIMKKADLALYGAKERGKNNVCRFSTLEE